MFLGQYKHSLDSKNRTSIPKKFRDELKNGGILTRGLENCLYLYSFSEWEVLSNRISTLPFTARDARNFSRYLFSNAQEVKFDTLGRMLIPDFLVKHALLKRELVVVGVLNRVEIWSLEEWEIFNREVANNSDEIAEKLSGSGI